MHIFGIFQRMNIRIFVRRTGLLVRSVSILRHRKLAFGCNKMITLKPHRYRTTRRPSIFLHYINVRFYFKSKEKCGIYSYVSSLNVIVYQSARMQASIILIPNSI